MLDSIGAILTSSISKQPTKVDSGAGVVVLTDMFGGTPSNLAISIMNGSNIEVIAAVNLPMLIKLASVRETSSLEQAVIQAQDAGHKYICVASRVLGAKPDRCDLPFDQVARLCLEYQI
jgi:mannose/fructose-specific phosphotransferase system component IIA